MNHHRGRILPKWRARSGVGTFSIAWLLAYANAQETTSGSADGTGESPAAQLAVADGVEATLFASESQLFNPASIDVDHRGRVWVCETVNYRKKLNPDGDRIQILEDSDGDGKVDSEKTFYQGTDIDGGHGVCVLGNQVIVSVSDRILLLTDTDGDDVADSKQLLFKGKVLHPVHGQHDHAIHAVMFGPDGRLYFNFGNFNAELRRADGTLVTDRFGQPVDGSRKPYMDGMVIRCETDFSEVEVLGYNFRNNWEVTVDSYGSMWQSDNDNGSSSCRVNFVMEHGNYGYRDEVTGLGYQSPRTNMSPNISESMWHQNDPGVIPNLLITGAGAPTGILVYEGDLLPEPFRGQMIHAEPGRNVVWAFPIEKSGAGYTATINNLAHSEAERNYRPSDVSVAPDGSLIIADWYDPVDCCHRTIDDTGRLFRVAPPGHAYTIPKFDFETPEGAVQALRSPNLSARHLAWTAIEKMGIKARPALAAMAKDPNPRFRARALWLLAEIDGDPQAAIDLAAQDDVDDVRSLALRIARRHRVPVEPVVAVLLRDPSALVRRECAVSLHRLTGAEATRLWVELAQQHDGKDRWYLEALGIGEHKNEAACFEAWLEAVGDDWNTPAGRDIIWRSRAPAAAGYLARLLVSADLPESEAPRLVRALDFHNGDAKQAALVSILAASSEGRQWIFIEAYRRIDAAALAARPDLVEQVQAAIPFSKGTTIFVDLVAKYDRRDLAEDLLDMVRTDPVNPPGIRALQQLLAFGEQQRVTAALAKPDQSSNFIDALGLAGGKDSIALLRQITEDLSRPMAVRILAVAAMAKSPAGGSELMGIIQAETLSEDLLAPALRGLLLSPAPAARAFAEAKQKLLPPEGGERWSLEKLLSAKAAPARGKAAFTKAGCIACHVVGGKGIQFGPELSEIGSKLDRANMLSAILEPNQTISLGYEGLTVELRDGTQLIGFVSGESETTLSLRTIGGLQRDIEVSQIKTRKPMEISLMPAGLDAAISSQELVDMVAWLGTLKIEPKGELDEKFFDGESLAGWSGNRKFWSVEDGAITGKYKTPVVNSEYIWSNVLVRNFHLAVDVKLTPDDRNAGIQFRSKNNGHGHPYGYQADVGAGFWGKLYHEAGRGKLDWNDNANKAVKPNEWNRYEILAVGDRIWTAINGTLCVAIQDPAGEKSGHIALQIHGGPAQTVRYRNPTLTHNPPIKLAGMDEVTLNAALPSEGEDIRPGGLPELLAASLHGSPHVNIDAPNGTYTLQLLLYEGWRSRSADIVIEGKTVREKYDMFKEQGANFRNGSLLRHTFTLTDSNIDIEIKGPLHLGGLILSKGEGEGSTSTSIVKAAADIDLRNVLKAINFGDSVNLSIGGIEFAAARVNATIDGVSNSAAGDVYAGEYAQQLPRIE